MNLASSASDLQLTILLLFPALLLPILTFGAVFFLGRILRLHALLSLLLSFGLLAALLVAASLWLDGAGQIIAGRVEQRTEHVEIRRQGDWRHTLSVELRYTMNRDTAAQGQPGAEESATSLKLAPAHFDHLGQADTVQLRVLPLYRSLALVRLANTSTMDFIPWNLLILLAGSLLLLIVLRFLMRSTMGGILAILILAGAALSIPLVSAYNQMQVSDNTAARPLRAIAQVLEVTRITEIDPIPCRPGSGSNCARRGRAYAVAQPYDIVQLRFVPQGAAAEIIAVDAVDADGRPSFSPGSTVELAYAADSARTAQILGTRHSHYWQNALGFARMFGLLALAISALLAWGMRRMRRKKAIV